MIRSAVRARPGEPKLKGLQKCRPFFAGKKRGYVRDWFGWVLY